MRVQGSLQQWKEKNAFFYLLLWIIPGIFLILRGTLIHLTKIEWIDIDLVPILLIYLVAKEHYFSAGGLAFLMGLLTDALAPCQLGLFAFTYSAILLGIIQCRQFLDFNNLRTAMLLGAVFHLAKWAIVVLVMSVYPLGNALPSIGAVRIGTSALITSGITPFLFYFYDQVRKKEEHREYA